MNTYFEIVEGADGSELMTSQTANMSYNITNNYI